MLNFFKNGGVFLLDEEDTKSESSYYSLEDLMGEEDGQDISESCIDEACGICIYYDCSVLSEDKAVEKYNAGDYVKYL
jgi:hypothetical protein